MFRTPHPHEPGSDPPRLSIICTGRNDDRAPDQWERLISLQRTLASALRGVSFEFLFIEWNPDPDRVYLGDALFLDEAVHYLVTREAHKRLIADAQMSTRDGKAVKGERAFLLNHANNVGMKHARGEWVLITNLDDLFPPELGELFTRGQTPAQAVGRHPQWSYRLLIRYRRAQRTALWTHTRNTLRSPRRALSWTAYQVRRVLGKMRRAVRRGAHLVRRSLIATKRFVLSLIVRARRIVRRLLGGPAARPRARRQGMIPLVLRWVRQQLYRIKPLRPIWPPAKVVAGGIVVFAQLVGAGVMVVVLTVQRAGQELHALAHATRATARAAWATVRAARAGLRHRYVGWRIALRTTLRSRAKVVYDFFLAPRVRWNVGHVPLTPGTLYRVRRQHVSETFARLGASDITIEDYLRRVYDESVPGPWNNHFPWTFACGDFLLMDRATWERIGGFPQQIGQLHADSVTMFRIVAEGLPVVLLDWNIYHMDHEDRFDAVPYIEYDFENVYRYFQPGWTKAEATLLERSFKGLTWHEAPTVSPEPALVTSRAELVE